MTNAVGKIIKVFSFIVLALAIIGGILMIFGVNAMVRMDGTITYSAAPGWLAAILLWIGGFVSFVFMYAMGTVVESVVAIREKVDRLELLPTATCVEEIVDA